MRRDEIRWPGMIRPLVLGLLLGSSILAGCDDDGDRHADADTDTDTDADSDADTDADSEEGSLAGLVVLQDSDSSGGALVTAYSTGGAGTSVITNPDGSWMLKHLPIGTYNVSASKDGFVPSSPVEVEVADDEATTVQTVTLRPISGVIQIDGGARYTNDADGTVTVSVLAFEADEMQFSEDLQFDGVEWKLFAAEVDFTLSAGDGEKTVYARFRTVDGYLTPPVHDAIVLDRQAPVAARVMIADGADYVTGPQVVVSLHAEDALSRVTTMRLALDGDVIDEPWIEYTTQVLLELPVGGEEPDDLVREVLAQYRDGAGNETAVVSDTVILDSVAPGNPSIIIEDGATLVASREVILTLSATSASEMQVSNDLGMTGAVWLPFMPFINWRLTAGAEQKTVFARFRDPAGNVTDVVQDSIELVATGGVDGVFLLEGAAPGGHAGITVEFGSDPVRTETTQADGGFAFADVPVGVYSLAASMAGFRSASVPHVALVPGENVNVGTQVLTIARGGLQGVALRQGAGAGAHGGILVEVAGTVFFAVTNGSGEWTIQGVPVGQYTVWAFAEGYLPAQASDVDVVADTETAVADLVLAANPGSIVGLVALEGEVAPNLGGVELLVAGNIVPTADDGSFEVIGITAGTYVLTAQLLGYSTEQTLVTVHAGEQTDAGQLTLNIARGVIEGQATLAGASDHSWIMVEVDGTGDTGLTTVSGAYRIEGVPVGEYSLTASKAGYVTRPVGNVSVKEGQTITAVPVELIRQVLEFLVEERDTGDREYLNDDQVKLVFSVVPPDAVEIWVAEDAGFSTGDWESFTDTEHDYVLLSVDGTVSVFAKFKDTLDQESPVFSSSVVLDRVPPLDASRVVIDNGAAFSNSADGFVTLTLVGNDATSGVEWVCISVDGVFDTELDQVFEATIAPVWVDEPFTDGSKTVWVQFVDLAGNRSVAPASDTIYIDRMVPENATITINGGDATTDYPLVTLSLFAEDSCEAGYPGGGCGTGTVDPTQIMLGHGVDFSGGSWEPYIAERFWMLTPGFEVKMVFIKFQDAAGNATAPISAIIELVP